MHLDSKRDRERRTGLAISLRIYWQDESGRDNFANVRSLDISELGLRMELRQRIALRSLVSMQSDDVRLNGTGSVRYCDSYGSRHVVGVEFLGGLRWKPAPERAA